MSKKFEPLWMVRRLRFRRITPIIQMFNFGYRKKKFYKLKHIAYSPIVKFYSKRTKWEYKRLKAYINVNYDI